MELLLLQPDTVWASPEENRNRLETAIGEAFRERRRDGGSSHADGGACIVVLPEMFTTGFCASPQGVAEASAGETLDWMRGIAGKYGTAVAGSAALSEDGGYYNRLFFVKPDGDHEQYDKRHLFTFGGEDKYFTRGGDRVIVVWGGARIMLQVCYDLRFPVFSRNRGDYDMIIYTANWPEARRDAWDTLLKARAIENACYVAGVNRTGADPYNEYNGGTVLLDYLGRPVAAAGDGKEQSVWGSIDTEALGAFRKEFPVLDDRDEFRLL